MRVLPLMATGLHRLKYLLFEGYKTVSLESFAEYLDSLMLLQVGDRDSTACNNAHTCFAFQASVR